MPGVLNFKTGVWHSAYLPQTVSPYYQYLLKNSTERSCFYFRHSLWLGSFVVSKILCLSLNTHMGTSLCLQVKKVLRTYLVHRHDQQNKVFAPLVHLYLEPFPSLGQCNDRWIAFD